MVVCLLFAWYGVSWGERQAPIECRQCGSKIEAQNKRFSVLVMKGMEASAFDDIGCAIIWSNGECAMRQAAFDENAVVYDYDSGESIPIEKAFYVVDADIKTPHGYGICGLQDQGAGGEIYPGPGQGQCACLFSAS